MSANSSSKPVRPLSPHLQIYKPQLTSALSIFHRATGVALAFGLPVFVAWLVALSGGKDVYSNFISYFHCSIGQIVLFGWTLAFFYHFFCGIRHLLWDAGYFLSLPAVYRTGYIVLALTVLLTACLWLKLYGVIP
jgi:succinate dehydrogenase / fumarate reductase, cytochrome b subunit